MIRLSRLCARLFVIVSTGQLAVPASAAEEAVAAVEVANPYSALVDAIDNGVNQDVLFSQVLAQARTVMLTESPDIAWIEQQVPGTLDKMLAAMTPALRKHSLRLTAEYRTNMIDLLARNLTVTEASEAADFYASPLGQVLLGKVQDNYSVTSTIADGAAESTAGEISAAAVERDRRRTLVGTLRALTPEQTTQIEQQLAGKGWPHKFQALGSQMVALRVRMENAPMLPEDDAAMSAALTTVIEDAVASMDEPAPLPEKHLAN